MRAARGGIAFALAAYALYWVVGIVAPQTYRPSFLLLALVLTFLAYPAGTSRVSQSDEGGPEGPPPPEVAWRPIHWRAIDWALIACTIAALAWPLLQGDEFIYRAATPTAVDLVLGCALVVVVLEATRRTVGATLPITALVFLAYAFGGRLLDRIGLSLTFHLRQLNYR
jgi:TRAP-type uncharacterized transport system fused permease subunit